MTSAGIAPRAALVLVVSWLLAIASLLDVFQTTSALGLPQGQPAGAADTAELEVLQLRPNFYLIAGAGGHIAVQVGTDGVVVVDAGRAERADAVVAAIKKITTQPIRYVINTSADA